MNIRLTDLVLGAKIDSDDGELTVVAHWGEIDDKIYLELKKVVVAPTEELIKET